MKVDVAVQSLNAPFGDAVCNGNTFLLGLQTLYPVEFINMTGLELTLDTCVLKHALSRTEARSHRDQVNDLMKDHKIWSLCDELRDLAIKLQENQ